MKIDEKKIIERINYDNDLNPKEQLVARFGPYRDKTNITQQIIYDNNLAMDGTVKLLDFLLLVISQMLHQIKLLKMLLLSF